MNQQHHPAPPPQPALRVSIPNRIRTVLVTGATGYIGGRLVPQLLNAGLAVRVLVCNPERLRDVPWAGQVDIRRGDLLDPHSLVGALDGVDVLYYLVHSMTGSSGKQFMDAELASARALSAEAARARVRGIIYLGGLHPDGVELSRHLASRQAVGEVLHACGVPTVTLQAGVVIGSGSASFEMIRHLTEVLPWMPAPRWVRNQIQPIAIRDVLYYLLSALALPEGTNRAFDVGGPDVLTYADMMNGYAACAGLPVRKIWALPVLTPGLASHWVNLVTPIPYTLAKPLVGSLQHDCVASERDIDRFIPHPEGGLTPYRAAVSYALLKHAHGEVDTSWKNASVLGAPSDPLPSDPAWAGSRVYTDLRVRETPAPPAAVWQVVEGIGGRRGWYSMPFAWSVRGMMDTFVGGVGLRRGRRHPDRLEPGEALDFWRVERIDRGTLLRLRAEMKVPGLAWLEFVVEPLESGGTRYSQRAVFFPHGLWGRAYWFAVLPFHGIIFNGMATNITNTALRRYRSERGT